LGVSRSASIKDIKIDQHQLKILRKPTESWHCSFIQTETKMTQMPKTNLQTLEQLTR